MMPRTRKDKAKASKPVQTPYHINQTEANTQNIPENSSITISGVRRSARIRENAAQSTRRDKDLGSSRSAAPQKRPKAKLAGSRRRIAKPNVRSKRGTAFDRVQREDSRSDAAPPPERRSRNDKSHNKKASVPVKTIEAQNKPKSKTRVRSSQKREPSPSSPTHSIIHNEKSITQSGRSSLSSITGQRLTKSPQSPAQSYNILSEEALKAHTQHTELEFTQWGHLDGEEYASYPFNQNTAANQTLGDSDLDPEEAFNRKWGYLPPFSEESEQVIAFIIDNPALAKSMARIQPGTPKFGVGLRDRNVALEPSDGPDKCKSEIESLDTEGFMNEPVNEERHHELLWNLDQAKITATSSEALFQRTIMMSLIARHFLIYQRSSHETQLFDFSVEELWTCPPMPSRVLNGITERVALGQKIIASEHQLLTKPRPDLAVAFNRKAIITDKKWHKLPNPIRELANFERTESHIFHFLVIETKNPMISVEGDKAFHQCSNCASQALFNFYEFFRDAGPKHEDLYFEKVRFFSIVTNRAGLLIRIHRAVQIPKDDMVGRVIPRDPNYRLNFEFENFARIDGVDEFGRSKVLNVLKKILKYAKDTLHPLIEDATSDIFTKLNTDIDFLESRTFPDAYRHGQPGIGNSMGSRQETPVSSVSRANMAFLQRKIQGVPLNSNSASSAVDASMRSRQMTRKLLPSKLGSIERKRKASQTRVEDHRSESRSPTIPSGRD